jgi:hypothetical protein
MKLLSTAYFPDVAYFYVLVKEEAVLMEKHEYFVKQTHRNRCAIATAQGPLHLSIPLINEGNKTSIANKKIAYTENWQAKHWRAIESSYNKSAYFEYFEEDLKTVLLKKHEFLFELNLELIRHVLHVLRLKREILFTSEYKASGNFVDLRDESTYGKIEFPPYYQVFKDKTGFLPNISILDLVFNEGLRAKEYLAGLVVS